MKSRFTPNNGERQWKKEGKGAQKSYIAKSENGRQGKPNLSINRKNFSRGKKEQSQRRAGRREKEGERKAATKKGILTTE